MYSCSKFFVFFSWDMKWFKIKILYVLARLGYEDGRNVDCCFN